MLHFQKVCLVLGLLSSPASVTGEKLDHPGSRNCTEKWMTQYVDHFNFNASSARFPVATDGTFQQRYLVYDKYFVPGGPIFFYTGNEADVTLYVNSSGLMWENAEAFGACLVWAEHRYYGKSSPFGASSFGPSGMQWLTHEQAMADYVALIAQIKQSNESFAQSAVIAFGGSYGGMLSAWLRMKYPHVVQGSIAASAPILAFQGLHSFDTNSYWRIVTEDATPAAGSVEGCSGTIRESWPLLFSMGETEEGRQRLGKLFRVCNPLKTTEQVVALAYNQMMAFDNMAMGNYAIRSNYLTGGGPMLPPYPVRVACRAAVEAMNATASPLEALRAGSNIFNNASKLETCLLVPQDIESDGVWDYQWCSEMLPQETYFSRNGKSDMFWPSPYNFSFIKERCDNRHGIQPRAEWIAHSYGGLDGVRRASNIVFSNGAYDPWSSGGVPENVSTDSVISILIADGAHHSDLFFSDPMDPPSVIDARTQELKAIENWIKEYGTL